MSDMVMVSCNCCNGSGYTLVYTEEELAKECLTPEDGELKRCADCDGIGSWSVPKPDKDRD